MKTSIRIIVIAAISTLVANVSLGDTCTDAIEAIERVTSTPPNASTETQLRSALNQCPGNVKSYDLVGRYYEHWWKNDIDPEKRAYFNYLATEYYAQGIKACKGDAVQSLRYKLAALESSTEDITEVGIRSVKPYARLNIRVLFEFNSANLTEGAQSQLDVLGKYLAEGNASRIILEGHTDMAGTEEYNMKLSVERSASTKQYLVSKFNLSPDTIEIQGYGFDRLADVDHPYSQKNRRVRVRKLPK